MSDRKNWKIHISHIEKVNVTTSDSKQLGCHLITIHLEAQREHIDIDNINRIVKEKMYWMSKLFFVRSFFTELSAYTGAVRLAVNKELEEQGIICTRLHIKSVTVYE